MQVKKRNMNFRSLPVHLLLCLLWTACNYTDQSNAIVHTKDLGSQIEPVSKPQPEQLSKEKTNPPENLKYTWKKDYDLEQSLANQIPIPTGFNRIKQKEDSFGAWLRYLPLKNGKPNVKLFNGEEKAYQGAHFAVVDMDVGKRDLQQCADAIMRVKAEYHFSKNEYDQIHFNFTSGDRVAFDDWMKGRKPSIKNKKVVFSNPSGAVDASYANFKKYLVMVFSYAGTASLSKELQPIKLSSMQIGDLFIKGGFPGHAILVVDMVENKKGEKRFLLAQSYMPAQEFHILKNPEHPNDPWYDLNFSGDLNTPEWSFTSNDLMRFP